MPFTNQNSINLQTYRFELIPNGDELFVHENGQNLINIKKL
jgi:hypothetical protein